MNPERIFAPSTGYRISLAFAAAILSVFAVTLFMNSTGASMYGIPLASGFVLYWTYPKFIVSDTELRWKYGWAISRKYPYADYAFRIIEYTGMQSYMASFRPHSYALVACGKGKEQKLISLLDDRDFRAMVEVMTKAGARIDHFNFEMV